MTFHAIGGEIGNAKFDYLENDMGLVNTKQDLSVIKQVAALQSMKNAELETVWHKLFDHPPEVASRQYMIGKLAYKIQELAYGGVDSETENKIKAGAKRILTPTDQKKKACRFTPMIGTTITKEYHGKVHEVLVVNDGFAYNNEIYRSLSAIATKIAGTRWNGLKFFGVKK